MAVASDASKLLTLPVELHSHIASCLSYADVASLRLTCRATERAVYDYFTRSYFRKKQFYLASDSLEALIAIASSRFCDVLQHLVIGLDSYIEMHNHLVDQPMAANPKNDTIFSMNSYERRMFDQRTIVLNGTARDMLEAAISKLPRLRTIEVRDYNATGRDGSNRQYWTSYMAPTARNEISVTNPGVQDTAFGVGAAPATWASTVSAILLAAAAKANNESITRLEINTRKACHAIGGEFFVVPPFVAPQISTFLSRLTAVCLHVHFNDPLVAVSNTKALVQSGARPIGYIRYWGLCAFLNRLSNMEHLRINASRRHGDSAALLFLDWLSQTEPPVLQPLPTAINPASIRTIPPPISQPLRRLDLGRLPISPTLLIAIVKKFSHSLTHLCLHRILLHPDVPGASLARPSPSRSRSPWGNIQVRDNLWARVFRELVAIPHLELRDILIFQPMQVYGTSGGVSQLSTPENDVSYHGEDWRAWMLALVPAMDKILEKVQVPPPQQLQADDDDNEEEEEEEEESSSESSLDLPPAE